MSSLPARRARGWLVAALMAVLLAGFGAGFTLGRGGVSRAPSYLEQLTEALALRPDQVAAMEQVLADEDREIDGLLQQQLEGLRDRVAARRQHTEEELLARLDESQRALYGQLAAAGKPVR